MIVRFFLDSVTENWARVRVGPPAEAGSVIPALRGNRLLLVDDFNLFDAKASQIDYFYTSRLPGEPAADVDDIHFHPVEPRSFRLSATMQW